MQLSRIIRKVISLAKAANRARLADETAEDDSPMVTSYPATTKPRLVEEQRLREYLEALPPEVVYMLTAIMFLGRGDFEPRDLLDQYTDVSEVFGGPSGAASLMFTTMPLPELLAEGARRVTQSGLDLDKLLQDHSQQ